MISRTLNGSVLYHDETRTLRTLGRSILVSTDRGSTWKRQTRVPATSIRYCLAIGRLGRRLLRGGVRHAFPCGDRLVAVSGRRWFDLGMLDDPAGEPTGGPPVVGSNPLCTPVVVAGSDGPVLYYGEYRPNRERSPVHIWRSRDCGRSFEAAWTFTGVRHVHGVFHDPFMPHTFWVTTGDDDSESAIWRSDDNFGSLDRVISGGQQARAVDLVFTRDAVYFGSDTPREQNAIYRLDRATRTVHTQAKTPGSIFWGRRTPDGWRVFCSVVERSAVNHGRWSELWAAPPGRDDWRCVLRRRKDPLSDKYFDHGQLRLPAGPGAPGVIWVSPYAVAGDQRCLRLNLSEAWSSA